MCLPNPRENKQLVYVFMYRGPTLLTIGHACYQPSVTYCSFVVKNCSQKDVMCAGTSARDKLQDLLCGLVAVYWHVRGSVYLPAPWLWAGVCTTLTALFYFTGQHWSHYGEPCVSDYPGADYREASYSCCLLACRLL